MKTPLPATWEGAQSAALGFIDELEETYVHVSRVRMLAAGRAGATEDQVRNAIRAYGNASEYIPLFVLLFIYLGSASPTPFELGVAMVATVSRILHAIGMLRSPSVMKRHPLRFWGATGTYLCLFALAFVLVRRTLT